MSVEVPTLRRLHLIPGAARMAKRIAREEGTTVGAAIVLEHHPRAARARHRIWVALNHTLGLSFSEIGRLWGAHQTTVLGAVHKYERELEASYAA